jgi:CRISPR-associated protein Csb1
MEAKLDQFDGWLKDDGPAALVIREHLIPVEGADGVLFPPTFVDVGYNIDPHPQGGNVCLVDSVGSQANRIEPLFAGKDYADLVPQIRIKAGDKVVNLLEAGHRAGDAVVRCSELQAELRAAFQAALKGNAWVLAKIAPTSIVFGAWDSRDTQAKLPRLIASTIRAFDVRQLKRSAQYVPAVDYVAEGLLAEPEDLRDADGKVKGKHPFAQRGYSHQPATGALGGVIADRGVRRDASLHLACLRLLDGGDDPMALRRYILGLALTAFTYSAAGYLRQGCHLVANPEKSREFKEVYADGRRVDAAITHPEAVAYARLAMREFGVGESRTVKFSPEMAQRDLTGDGGGGRRTRRAATNR